MNGNAHYRRLLRLWATLTAQSTLTPAEQAEKAWIEDWLTWIEIGWGR